MTDSTTGLDSSCIQPFVFSVCSKCSAFSLKISTVLFHITTEQNTYFYQRILLGPIFHCLDFIFKIFPPKQMLLLWQHLITSLTLECVSLNDFRVRCSRKSGARDSFPYLNFIILGQGGIPCFTEEITFEPQCEDFLLDCMKSHNF